MYFLTYSKTTGSIWRQQRLIKSSKTHLWSQPLRSGLAHTRDAAASQCEGFQHQRRLV